MVVPSDWDAEWEGNQLKVTMDGSEKIDLSRVTMRSKPKYIYSYNDAEGNPKQMQSNYNMVGYALMPNSSNIRFTSSQSVTTMDFGGSDTLLLYVAWNPEYILKFVSDNSHYGNGE